MRSPLEDPAFLALYEPLGPLGRGGMGHVFKIRHRVWELELAAKVPLPHVVDEAGGLARFRAEAETWIRLPSHPNVVTCHYVRVFGDVPMIFSEYVGEGSLADAIARGALRGRTDDALAAALDVARGLAHAHDAGVVHQDVKPSNVLLDAHGAKITDFGIARTGKDAPRVAPDPARPTQRRATTLFATALGMTPLYASPEQLAAIGGGGATEIGRATDVWSLGLTLFEALAGEARWRPGAAAYAIARADLEGDLVRLLERLLARDPAERPSSKEAAEMIAQALEARGVRRPPAGPTELLADGLNNRAVSALDLGSVDEARRTLREALAADPAHPEAVFNDALLAWRAGEISDRAVVDRVKQAISSVPYWEAALLEAWVEIERGDEAAVWMVLDTIADKAKGEPRGTRAVARASRAAREAIREVASFRAHHGIADGLVVSADERHAITGGRDGKIRVFELATGRRVKELPGHTNYVFGLAPTRDLSRVYSTGWDGKVRAFDVAAGTQIWEADQPGSLYDALLSPDERRLFTSSFGGTLREWSIEGDRGVHVREWLSLPNDTAVKNLELTPDRTALVASAGDGKVRFFDLATGEVTRTIETPSTPYGLAFATLEGRACLVVGGQDQEVTIWDLATNERVALLEGMQSWVDTVAVSHDGRWLVCSNGLGWCAWDLPARRCLRTFDAPALVTGAQFLSNGELVTLDWQGVVRRYRLERPEAAPIMVSIPQRARDVAASRTLVDAALAEAAAHAAEGRVADAIAAVARAREARGFERAGSALAAWEALGALARRAGVRTAWPLDRWGPVKASSGMALGPGFVATADADGAVTIWSRATREATATLAFETSELAARALALSDDARTLAVGTYGRVHLYDLASRARRSVETSGYTRALAWSGPLADDPDGLLAILDDRGAATVRRVRDLSRVCAVRGPENWVEAAVFVDDGRRLVVGDYDGNVLVWDVAAAAASGYAPPADWDANERDPEPATALVANVGTPAVAGRRSVHEVVARGRRLYYACSTGKIHVVDLDAMREIGAFGDHDKPISCFELVGDAHVVTGGFDNTVRIYDLATGARLAKIDGHTHAVWDVAVEDVHRFLTVSDDDTIRRFYVDWDFVT